MQYQSLICARGGSKGLPGKNTRDFCGKPLIAHAIEMALSIPTLADVIVSTDDPSIASVAQQYGANVPFSRPHKLATDKAKEWDVWRHCLRYLEDINEYPDALVVLPTTSPLRCVDDVLNCMKLFEQGDNDGVLCVTEAHRNPEFNMVKMRDDQSVDIAISGNQHVTRRQDAPVYFDITTVCYVMKSDFVMSENRMMDGKIRANIVSPLRAADIDTLLDFEWAEYLAHKYSLVI